MHFLQQLSIYLRLFFPRKMVAMAIFRTVPDVPWKYLRYLPDFFNLKEAIEAVGDDGKKRRKSSAS
jgi:hypothetical protein